ncbi:MAG: DUF1073 domain-containing protein [Elusimicrobiaceae bacterium]|nr:DUF1073 domain-containing protein [Elusimicrobiaceae bacterium]
MVKNILNWFKKQEQKSAPAPRQEQAFSRFLEMEENAHSGSVPAPKMTKAEQDEILNRVFPVQKAALYDSNTGKYAMDADFGFSQMKGLITDSGRQDDRIFRFYGKHSFIGWQLCAMISQNWLVSNACAVPADDAVRPGWKNIIKSINQEDLDPEELTSITLKKYHLAEKCRQHIKNSRIFGVSYALLCVDGIDYSQPFNLDGVRPGSFKGISIIDPVWITPQWSAGALNNPASPNFYEPTYYQTNGAGRIHASHIIKLVHEEVPDLLKPSYYFGGLPLTQEIYERVYAAERTANEAPLLALTKRLLVVPTSLPRLIGKPKEAWDLIKMLIFGRDNQGIYFTEAGEKNQVHQVDTSLSDLDAVIMSQYQLVSAISRIPSHKLLKTDPKGLNNNGEYTIKDYNQELQSLQEKGMRPLIERVNALTLRSDLPHLKGVQEILTEFNPIDMPTEKEKAEVEHLQAQAASAYVAAGILSPEEVRKTLRMEKGGKYTDIDEELPAEEVPEDLDLPDDDDDGHNPPPKGMDSADWDENKHPRKDNGQFGTGSTTSSNSKKTSAEKSREKKEPEDENNLQTDFWENEQQKTAANSLLEKESHQKNIDDIPSVNYREVSPKEAARLNSATGLDLTGFIHQLTAGGIRHIFKSHGDEKTEKARGQLPITHEDIFLIPQITGDFDEVTLAKEKSEGRSVLIYKKKIGDMYFYYETVGGKKNKTLQPKTMYKRKAK